MTSATATFTPFGERGSRLYVKARYNSSYLCLGTQQIVNDDLTVATFSMIYPLTHPSRNRSSYRMGAQPLEGDAATQWRIGFDWDDQDNIFTLLNGLSDDIDYVTMSLEGASDLPDHIMETGKLARLQILWDGEFLSKLDMWEALILFCCANGIRSGSCGFADHLDFQAFLDILVITYDTDSTASDGLDMGTTRPYPLRALYALITSVCATCSTLRGTEASKPTHRCSKCRITTYCCERHQELHWEGHKLFCKTMRKLRPDRIKPEDLAQVTCNDCGRQSRKLLKCARCMKIAYCSKAAQTRDWKIHRLTCVPLNG